MKRAAQFFCVVVLFCSLPALGETHPPADAAKESGYRHAYYLFLVGTPNGCEDCYVPLLITRESLEQIAKVSVETLGVLLITYERDSIWHNEGLVSLKAADIEVLPRILRLRSRKYRYQEITSAEVEKLLRNPLGAIPISRPSLPPASSPGPTIEELVSAFQKQH